MTDPDAVVVLLPSPCEWCSTGLYRRRNAEIQATVFGATARLCATCAKGLGVTGPPLAYLADTLPMLAVGELALYLQDAAWTTAKTVPEYPHQYLLLSKSPDPLTHLRAVRYIRANGERREWSPTSGPAAGRMVWCHYWASPTHLHWTQPSRHDPILNRKPLGQET